MARSGTTSRQRSIGRVGKGEWVKLSQPEQAMPGRTTRCTMKRPGTYSGSSVTSSPNRCNLPPNRAQASSPVVSSIS